MNKPKSFRSVKSVCAVCQCVCVFLEDTVCPLGAPLLPVFCSGGKAAPQIVCTIPVQFPFPILPSSGNPNSASSGKRGLCG